MAGVGQMFGYIYDADGNRVAKGTISSWSCDPAANGFQVTSTYALDLQGQTVTENAYRNGASSWVHTDLFANGQLMATYDPDGLHFQIADWLGTRRVQTDALGQIEQTCQSLPFGNGLGCTPVAGAAQDATERHFTGKERDAETNNDYFGARYFASTMGRFMSPDDGSGQDITNPQSLNMYSYVQNNPLTNTDPDGHTCQTNSSDGNVYDDMDGNGCSTVDQQDAERLQNGDYDANAWGNFGSAGTSSSPNSGSIGQQALGALSNLGQQIASYLTAPRDPGCMNAFTGAGAVAGAGIGAYDGAVLGAGGGALVGLAGGGIGAIPGGIGGGFA